MAKDTKTPQQPYLADQQIDSLARMQTELLSELWILRDRVHVLEHLLSQAGVIADDAIEAFDPPQEFSDKLQQIRDGFVGRVIGAGHRDSLDLGKIKQAK